jgi:hypothetical protein
VIRIIFFSALNNQFSGCTQIKAHNFFASRGSRPDWRGRSGCASEIKQRQSALISGSNELMAIRAERFSVA